MKLVQALSFFLVSCTASAAQLDDYFDQLDNALTVAAFNQQVRARWSGTIDLEFYHFEQPPPGLIDSKDDNLFNPRLTLFFDAQIGSYLYCFAQARLDRGFDPSDRGAQVHLDEYAVRLTPWNDDRFNLQIGQFPTVVGNWVPRHLSWDNPFINAPLVYENIMPISDKKAPSSPADFASGFHGEKYEYSPVIWGPSYTTGISISGRLGRFDYAGELKNASLSSRPESWPITATGLDHPTFSGRVGFRPDQMWTIGLSGSSGTYFRPEAESTLPRGRDISDYRESVLGQDVSFAWHHVQIWAELYEARFDVPRVGQADTFAYYFEAKYKFTPQLFGAVRWNQQLFNDINNGVGGHTRWANDLGRIDLAATYRFTSHIQLKMQYSFQQETTGPHDDNHLFAAQFTVRF